MYVPREEAVPLDMTVEEGMKLVISGGIVVPPDRPARPTSLGKSPLPGTQQPHGVVALEQVE